jgi:AcrR family transcriptional regulator
MGASEKRNYNSNTRKEKARLTRSKMLATAKSLFEKRGYDKTTIDQIAEKSKVSKPTVFALFKSKLGILRAIMDECFPPSEHASLVEKTEHENCPKKRLAIAAELARNIYDAEIHQSNLLQSACILSPEFKKLQNEKEQRRYQRLASPLKKMHAENLLKDDLKTTKALDIFWALTGRDMYRLLVIDRDWTSDDYEQWLAETLATTLLEKV